MKSLLLIHSTIKYPIRLLF
uniref:Uncharacterized protein n=1 Tax=Anguilla anguilla TaxID=7936 RepID=A0A0E9Q3S6_ANGAN